MKKLLASICCYLFLSCPSLAQSSPGWGFGTVPTPAQWNAAFAVKADYLGAAYCPITGCTLTGTLFTAASSTVAASLNIAPGVPPTPPNNGDMWSTSSGLYVQINGSTIGPLTEGAGGSFAATAPIAVTFPSSVVTYALNFNSSLVNTAGNLGINLTHSNAFTAGQSFNLNGSSLGTALTGTVLQVSNVAGTSARYETDGYAASGYFSSVYYGGTPASPTTCVAATEIGGHNGWAYDGSAVGGPAAAYRLFCNGTWSTSSFPTYADVAVTPNGSTAEIEAAKWTASSTTAVNQLLGTAGSIVGSLSFANATSGTVTLQPTTGALGSSVLTLPAVTDTVAGVLLADGGTGGALTASNGGIVWTNSSQMQVLAGTATARQMLQSGSSATPAWSTATWPATTTINQVLYSSAANTVTGLATVNGGVLNTSSGGVPSITATPVLGLAGTTVGTIGFQNATSGTETIQPATGALGSGVATLIAGTYNLLGDSTTQTLTNKTITSSTNSLGGVTMALGSDATGDVYYRSSGGVLTRLPAGSNGQALELVSGLPAWATITGTGTVTNIATGSGLTGGPITTTGTISLASQPAFSATLSASQTGVASSTTTLVTFNTVSYNVGSFFNTGTNRWVPPAGTISLDACLYATGALQTATSFSTFIYKDGSALYQAINDIVSTQGGNCITIQDRANGTDYYQVYVNVTTTAGTATLGNNTAPTLNFFQGYWVSP